MHGFVWLGLILLAIWAVLWIGFHIVSALVHLLVIVALVLIVWGLLKKGANAIDKRL